MQLFRMSVATRLLKRAQQVVKELERYIDKHDPSDLDAITGEQQLMQRMLHEDPNNLIGGDDPKSKEFLRKIGEELAEFMHELEYADTCQAKGDELTSTLDKLASEARRMVETAEERDLDPIAEVLKKRNKAKEMVAKHAVALNKAKRVARTVMRKIPPRAQRSVHLKNAAEVARRVLSVPSAAEGEAEAGVFP